MLEEFKKFALKGNVIDMAVGVIIGAAFGKIVSSLVADLLMPLLGLITGGVSLAGLSVMLRDGEVPLVLNYGLFLQNIVDFLLISISIFAFVKLMSKFKKKEEPKPAEPAPLSKEAELLSEIVELLKEKE